MYWTRNEFGNQKIQISVTVAVRVGRLVDRHANNPGCKIGTVIQVVAAQKILVRLAVAGVLRDDHAGHGFQYLAAARKRAPFELLPRDDALACRIPYAHTIVGRARDRYFVELLHAFGACCRHPAGARQHAKAGGRPQRSAQCECGHA